MTRHLYQAGNRDSDVEMALTASKLDKLWAKGSTTTIFVAAYGLIWELSRSAFANLSLNAAKCKTSRKSTRT